MNIYNHLTNQQKLNELTTNAKQKICLFNQNIIIAKNELISKKSLVSRLHYFTKNGN